jgi:pilus assembly protein CpaE
MAMSLADDVIVVTQLDLPCLRNVVRLMMSFEHHEKLREKVKIVVNRVGHETGQISVRKAQETLGQEVYWQIPNDFRTMIEVRNNGVPLIQQSPKATITLSINQLAAALSGKQLAESPSDALFRSSWLRLWPTRAATAKAEPK